MREPVPNGDLFGGDTRTYAGNGYAADPGTGPAGETCGSCAHYEPGRFKKCGIGRKSNGPGTDILKSAPACHRWQRAPEQPKPERAPRKRNADRTTAAELAKAAGMKRARKRAEKAHEGWAKIAMGYLMAWIRTSGEFLAEDLVLASQNAFTPVPPPPDARAWGSVIRTAAKRGLIERTGDYRLANTSNRSPKPLWRRAINKEKYHE